MYDKIKKWYKQGLWSKDMVRNAVGKLLTQEQADAITESGAAYE